MNQNYDDKFSQIKRNINIVDYAELIGFTVKRIGEDTYTLEEHDSVRISNSKNIYSRHSNCGKGGSIIDFVMEFTEFNTYPAAVTHLMEELEGNTNRVRPAYTGKQECMTDYVKPELKLNEPIGGFSKRAWTYLIYKRYIDPNIVSDAFKRGEIYQDIRGNVCFIGKDYDGEVKYGHTRSTRPNYTYRGDMPGSSKAVSFSMNLSVPLDKAPKKLFVSEGAIDCLSLATLLKINKLNEYDYGYLSLSGVAKKALVYHLPFNPQLETIYLCQDNDEAGNRSRVECKAMLLKEGFKGKVFEKPPKNKDYNDDLAELMASIKLDLMKGKVNENVELLSVNVS